MRAIDTGQGALKYGETAIVLIPADKTQRAVSGKVYSSFGGEQRPWAAVKLDAPVKFADCAGAPVLDAAGLLAGVVVADEAASSLDGDTICLGIERPEDAPELDR